MSDETKDAKPAAPSVSAEPKKDKPAKSAGEIAYEAYYQATGNTPRWATCPTRSAWEKAGRAVLLANVRG